MKSDWKDFVDIINNNIIMRNGLYELASVHPTGLSKFEGRLLKEISIIFKYAMAYLNLILWTKRELILISF